MDEARRVLILGVLPNAEGDSLREILATSRCYDFRCVSSPAMARLALADCSPGIVVTLDRFESGQTWKDVLAAIAFAGAQPTVLVSSRLADDRLWAEVLNHGGFDVIEVPYRRSEVLYAIGFAWRAGPSEHEPRPMAASAAKGFE
jgi:hypothetical protein